jgi:RNA polymerase sigma-70 factor (ECF subfamily)
MYIKRRAKEATMNEEELIQKTLLGDENAFEQLYRLYATKAYRTALLITGNVHTAEDVVQESFVQCYRTLNRLKKASAFSSYFYRILTRNAWLFCKRDRKNIGLEDSLLADTTYCDKSYVELYTALASLDTKLRTVVVLFYFNDLPVKEIAKITHTLEGTVKSRLYTARKRLSQILKEEDYQ